MSSKGMGVKTSVTEHLAPCGSIAVLSSYRTIRWFKSLRTSIESDCLDGPCPFSSHIKGSVVGKLSNLWQNNISVNVTTIKLSGLNLCSSLSRKIEESLFTSRYY